MIKLKIAWIGFFIMLLTGCGFHLQGFEPLPPGLQTIMINSDTPYDPFVIKVHNSLVHRHAIVTDDAVTAPFVLHINNIHQDVVQQSVATTQADRQYQVSFAATFSIVDKKGKTILNPLTLAATQSTVLYSNQLTTNTPQVNDLVAVLQQQVITQLFDHLSTPLVMKALRDSQSPLNTLSQSSHENPS